MQNYRLFLLVLCFQLPIMAAPPEKKDGLGDVDWQYFPAESQQEEDDLLKDFEVLVLSPLVETQEGDEEKNEDARASNVTADAQSEETVQTIIDSLASIQIAQAASTVLHESQTAYDSFITETVMPGIRLFFMFTFISIFSGQDDKQPR